MVRTDQRSLKFLLDQREVNLEYQKWLSKLIGFDFEIEYKPGLENKAVNALSRIDVTATIMAMSVPCAMQLSEVRKAVEEDAEFGAIVTSIRKGKPAPPGYVLLPDNLLYNDRLVLPRASPLV